MPSVTNLVLATSGFLVASTIAHTVVTYPLWRGNTLILNNTFPRGMQWTYPCGGIEPTTNRTHWPLSDDGGAVAVQPGWFRGHEQGLIYINIGLGENPENYSFPLTVFHFTGPAGDNPYPGTLCLPQVRLTPELRGRVKEGDKASLQVVQASKHGAAQYNCADIIFTEDLSLVPPVNGTVCFNSTDITINEVSFPARPTTTTVPTSSTLTGSGVTNTGAATTDEVVKGGGEGMKSLLSSGMWNLVPMLMFVAGGFVLHPSLG